MSGLLIDNVDEVIEITDRLIANYKRNMETCKKQSSPHMCNSYKGSIIGLIALLSQITSKSSAEYFEEIFPEKEEEGMGN